MGSEEPRAVGAMDEDGSRWTKQMKAWIPEIDDNHKIRVNKLRKDLDLDEAARADGRINKPATLDQTLNEIQLEICNRVFSGILILNQFLAEQLGAALDGVRKRRPASLDVADYKAQMGNEVNRVFAERSGDINSLRQGDLAAQRDLRYFRNRNKLTREAYYKDSVILTMGIIFGLLVLESAINGALFKDVVNSGFIGGAIIALIISALNIALGIIAGLYGWRNLGHVSIGQKLLGAAVAIFCHGSALGWNLLVCHFREVAEIAAQNPNYDFNFATLTNQAVDHLGTKGVFGISSIFAWALLVLGILIHFIAAKEGWDDIADRYPDYKKVDKRAKDARAHFDESLVDLRESARIAANGIVVQAEQREQAAKTRLNEISGLCDLASQREKEIRDSEDEWVSGGSQLLKCYRDINVEIRGEDEPPVYFDSFPDAESYRTRRFSGSQTLENKIDEHVLSTRENLKALSTLRLEGQQTLDDNAERIRQLRAEVNVLLSQLDKKVASTKAAATNEAMRNLRERDEVV